MPDVPRGYKEDRFIEAMRREYPALAAMLEMTKWRISKHRLFAQVEEPFETAWDPELQATVVVSGFFAMQLGSSRARSTVLGVAGRFGITHFAIVPVKETKPGRKRQA